MIDGDVTWRDYVDNQVTGLRREAAILHSSTEQAIAVSLEANEKRFTSVEDLRGQLSRYLPRAESDSAFSSIQVQLLDLAQLKANERLQVERVDSLRRETEALRVSGEKAIEKSEHAIDRRLEQVNAFREQLNDQAQRFLPREVYEAAIKDVQNRMDQMQTRLDLASGSKDGENVVPRLDAIRAQIDGNSNAIIDVTAAKRGGQESRAGMYAVLAAIGTLFVVLNIVSGLLIK